MPDEDCECSGILPFTLFGNFSSVFSEQTFVAQTLSIATANIPSFFDRFFQITLGKCWVQRELFTIEKHGLAVAVVMSGREYQQMEPERLRAKLAISEGQLDGGKGKTVKVFLRTA